jgi:hypothetical protein
MVWDGGLETSEAPALLAGLMSVLAGNFDTGILEPPLLIIW